MSVEYLVTGGAGFIGSNIVKTLVARGKSVRVLDDFSSGHARNLRGVLPSRRVLRGDVRDPSDVRRAVRGVRYVLHLAARPSVIESVEDPALTHEVNITGTLNLLLAARAARVERFVLSSSCAIYGDPDVLPVREETPVQPLSPYAFSKLAGEHYLRLFHALYNMPTFSLRYFNVYGPRQDPKSTYAAAIPRFIAILRSGGAPTIFGDGRQTRDFVFVEDVVAANLACCRAPLSAAGGVYNIGGGSQISINELAQRLAKRITGRPVRATHAPARPGEVRFSRADITRARRALGWRPRWSLEQGLAQTVEWFEAAPKS